MGVTGPRTYPHGVTSWIDTEQDDPLAAGRFYAGLFGARAGGPGHAFLAASAALVASSTGFVGCRTRPIACVMRPADGFAG